MVGKKVGDDSGDDDTIDSNCVALFYQNKDLVESKIAR
jgi:hypothetical protein